MKARAEARVRDTAPAKPRVRRTELPHRSEMARKFGPRVAHLPVYTGPAVEAALKRRGAEAAALDGTILLRTETAPQSLIAHEVVHALQQAQALRSGEEAVERLDSAVAEPAGGGAENEAEVLADNDDRAALPDAPLHEVAPGVVALRRTGEGEGLSVTPPEPAPAPTSEPASGSGEAARSGEAEPDGSGDAISDASFEPAPTFAPAEAPETALDPAVQAERDAAKAEAEAALASASEPSEVMAAYESMTPSVKAMKMGELDARLGETNAAATEQLASDTPVVKAELSGEDDLPAPEPIQTPETQAGEVSLDAEAPVIDVPDGPDQPEITPDPTFGSMIARLFGGGASPDGIERQIDNVSTDNPGIRTDIEDRADVPTEGESDPALMDEEKAQRDEQATEERRNATQGIVEGPGPEAVAPRAMEAEAELGEIEPRETTDVAVPEGAEQLNSLELPDEVVAGFDQSTGEAMAASAATARAEMEGAEDTRDTAHEEAVDKAETDRAAAEGEADESQRSTITERRDAIQSERQSTVDAQAAAVEDIENQAENRRQEDRAAADTRIESDRSAINARYDEAERDSEAEVNEGERDAEREQRDAERESENESWWDRATSFIREAFEALTSAINAIFDAVRAAVTAIIDAAVAAVTLLIEAAAEALKALVSAYGEFLKGLVDGLLGDIFPGLAAALTEFIDSAVTFVNSAIDAVAERLVAAVQAIGEALKSAINALLDLYQSAINAALSILAAALTGDWGAVLRQILESVLSLLGIDPQAFYALIAQAQDAVERIVNDPAAFAGNMLEAFMGGVRQFSENFVDHLRNGVIGWLTGALGDIEMPSEWNLMGLLDLARQILGLTWDFVRERAARVIGEENVERLEMAFDWIMTLVTEGWQGVWNRILDQLDSLKDMVIESIRNFVLEKVVIAAITWLAGLFNPVGAIVKLVMTIWNIYQFVSNQLQRVMGIATAIVEGISNIARGVLGPAMDRVEEVLGDLLPVVIDLLMSLLGVTGVARRVREIIGNIRQRIADAVDNMIDRVMSALGLRRGRGEDGDGEEGEDSTQNDDRLPQPVPVVGPEGTRYSLSVERESEMRATAFLSNPHRPLSDHMVLWQREVADLPESDRKEEKFTLAQAKMHALDQIVVRTIGAQDDDVSGLVVQARDRLEELAPAVREVIALRTPIESERLEGVIFREDFSMTGEHHTLTLRVVGDTHQLTMASANERDIQRAALAGIVEARQRNLPASVIRDLEQVASEADQLGQWLHDHFEALVLPARDDHEQTKLTARVLFDHVLSNAIAVGRLHQLTDLVGLGHPSRFVLNDEIASVYRPDWRPTFYRQNWSSTITAWQRTELAKLRVEARRLFPTHPYVTDPTKQEFLVRDRNGQYPPNPVVDYVRPRNTPIDHVRPVSDHFQQVGRDQKQDDRETWYELQGNLQILNQEWNSRKGGSRISNWSVTEHFRGPGEV